MGRIQFHVLTIYLDWNSDRLYMAGFDQHIITIDNDSSAYELCRVKGLDDYQSLLGDVHFVQQ